MGGKVTFKLRHYKSRLRLAPGRTPEPIQFRDRDSRSEERVRFSPICPFSSPPSPYRDLDFRCMEIKH
jgi:hypothetical protein